MNSIDNFVDEVIDHYDNLFLAGKFCEANSDLENTDIANMNSFQVVAILSATLSAKPHLPARESVVNEAIAMFPGRPKLFDGLR